MKKHRVLAVYHLGDICQIPEVINVGLSSSGDEPEDKNNYITLFL